jgi:uncharacterized membrane protein YebE (DUF533 family)
MSVKHTENREMEEKKKESFYNMWRAIIAMSNIDGVVSTQEVDFIKGFLEKDFFDVQQTKNLRDDLENKKDPRDFIDKVDHPAHLSQLHHLAKILFNVDGMDIKEQAFAKDIQELVSKKIDLLGASRLFEDELRALREKEAEESITYKSIFTRLFEKFF